MPIVQSHATLRLTVAASPVSSGTRVPAMRAMLYTQYLCDCEFIYTHLHGEHGGSNGTQAQNLQQILLLQPSLWLNRVKKDTVRVRN